MISPTKEHIPAGEEIAIGEHSAACEEAQLDHELKVELLPSNGSARRLKFSPSATSIKSSSSSSDSSLREGNGRIRVSTMLQDTTPSGNAFINGAIQYGKRAAEELIQQMAIKSSVSSDVREQSLLTDEIELDDADSGSDELEFLPTLPTSSHKSTGFTSATRLRLRSVLALLDSCRCSSRQRADTYPRCNIM